MRENYKVRIKCGDQEIEVESTDKSYVDIKVKEYLSALPQSIPAENRRIKESAKRKLTPKKQKAIDDGSDESKTSALDVAELVAFIKDSKNYPSIEANILNKKDRLSRIMMCVQFGKELHGDPYMTTGQIEAITNQFDVKVSMGNASNTIKENQKYFTAKTIRKKGIAVPYKLNRQGELRFQKILKGEAI